MSEPGKSSRPQAQPKTDEQLADELNLLWAEHEEWGTPDDHAIVGDRFEWEGYTILDRVRVTEDVEDNSDGALFEGDEGQIIGFFSVQPGMFNPSVREGLVVYFDGLDPMGVPIEYVEHA